MDHAPKLSLGLVPANKHIEKLSHAENIWQCAGFFRARSSLPTTKTDRMETLKEMIRAFGMNPEQILTKEALSMPNRTVIIAGNEPSEGQVDTLLKALKQKLKEELLEKPVTTYKTV